VECPQDIDQHRFAIRRADYEDSEDSRGTNLAQRKHPKAAETLQQTLHWHEHGSINQDINTIEQGEEDLVATAEQPSDGAIAPQPLPQDQVMPPWAAQLFSKVSLLWTMVDDHMLPSGRRRANGTLTGIC
jgi:hypothetical protein